MDIRLRDVEDIRLELFLAYEHDPEAVARSRFVPRERDAFLTRWRTRVLTGSILSRRRFSSTVR